MGVTILVDSTCDLSDELIKQNNIKIISLYVNFDNESYLDRVDITVEEMFDKVTKTGIMPKTAAISPNRYLEVFKEEIKNGSEVVSMGIGSGFSGSFQNASIARNELSEEDREKIHLVDSKNLSTGIGLLALKACKYRDMGYTGSQIKTELELLVPRVRSMFSIDTLDYLHKGGRCSGTTRLFGTMLRIKPVVRVINGEMVVTKKPVGKYERALEVQLDYVKNDSGNIDEDFMMVTHAKAPECAEYLKERLATIDHGVKNIYETTAGCIVSAHCGPKTIGILYIVKE